MFDKKGFTLIELLIVVAIIAILAAIAVPNFLEAQVRSKVSRQVANMRTVATALESYYVDTNRYPPLTDTVNGSWTAKELWKVYPGALTTPIAYTSSNTPLDDIFRHAHKFSTALCYQIYYLPSMYYQPPYTGAPGSYAAQCRTYGLWVIRSAGPDTYYQNIWENKDDYGAGGWNRASYDPTNGTVSCGDIYRSQRKADQAHTGGIAI